jgi:hypothetical protein
LVVSGGGTAIDVGRVVEKIVIDAVTGELISDEFLSDTGRGDSLALEVICQALSD